MVAFLNTFCLILIVLATETNLAYKSFIKDDFYTSLDNLQYNMEILYKKHTEELRNEFISFFEGYNDLKDLYDLFQKNYTPELLEENFTNKFSSINIEDKFKISEQYLDEFSIFFHKNPEELMQKLKFCKEWLKHEYDYLFRIFKNNIIGLLMFKQIKNETFKSDIENIKINRFLFPVHLYEFEEHLLSYGLTIEPYKNINPVHELMPKTEKSYEHYTYFDLLIQELSVYNLPPYYINFLSDWCEKHRIYSLFHKNNWNIYDKVLLFLNGIDKNVDNTEKINDFLNTIFLSEESLEVHTLDDNEYVIPNEIILSISEIEKIFMKFINQHKEIKNRMFPYFSWQITNYAAANKKEDEKKNKQQREYDTQNKAYQEWQNMNIVKGISNEFLVLREEFWSIHKDYNVELRPKLRNLIQLILDTQSDETLNEFDRIEINEENYLDYNLNLLNDFNEFSKNIFFYENVDYIFETFGELTEIVKKYNLDKAIYCQIKIIKDRNNFDCKTDIIYQLEPLFFDDGFKIKFLKRILKLIDQCKVTNNLRINVIQNIGESSKDSICSLKKELIKYINAEKEFISEMKNWAEEKIMIIDPSFVVKKPTVKSIVPPENSQKAEKSGIGKKTIIIASILIPFTVGFIVFLIYKYKSKILKYCFKS